jgi:hypothetical protein
MENFRGKGKKCMRHTHDTTFSENILDFYKILEESEQFFLLFLRLKDRPSCSLPFNVLTLTTCSIKNFFPRH